MSFYVDNIVVIGSNKDEFAHVKKVLGDIFDMKILEYSNYFLGIEIVQTPQGI